MKVAQAKRALLVLVFAACTSACSSLPDWANPDTWGEPSQTATGENDTPGAADQASQGTAVAEAGGKYPVLADTPDKAPPATSADEQKQVANALVADRSQAQYSAEQLQAGAEASAAPPPPVSSDAAASSDMAASSSAPATGSPAAAQSATPARAVRPSAAHEEVAAPTAAAAGPNPSSAVTRPSGPEDASLGFQPSHAPPLDPGVAQLLGSGGHERVAMAAVSGSAAPAATSGPPTATVVLGNGNGLDAAGLTQVQAAVAAFRAQGGQSYVRVVGHAASGAVSAAQALERAQAGATAVARELIRLGIPAKRVLVEASGVADGQSRRADIFVGS